MRFKIFLNKTSSDLQKEVDLWVNRYDNIEVINMSFTTTSWASYGSVSEWFYVAILYKEKL